MHTLRPRVLLVDDSPDLLRTWEHALRRVYGWEVTTAEGIKDAVAEGPLDGALVDHGLADGHGTEVLRNLRAEHPDAVLALITGGYPERDLLDEVASLGALFVLKPLHRGKLGAWMEAVQRAFDARLTPLDLLPGATRLSPRERRSVELVLERYSAPEVAEQLGISASSVRTYLALAYGKLDVRNLRELRARVATIEPPKPR